MTVRREYHILNSFSIESSFCGMDGGGGGTSGMGKGSDDAGYHFATSDLETTGERLAKTIFDYFVDRGLHSDRVYKELLAAFSSKSPSVEPEERWGFE